MINNVTNTSNVVFKGPFGWCYSRHTPVMKHYEEFHFQPGLKYNNPFKTFVRAIFDTIKEIKLTMKSAKKKT